MTESSDKKLEMKSEKAFPKKVANATQGGALKTSGRQLLHAMSCPSAPSLNGRVYTESKEGSKTPNLEIRRARHHRLSPPVDQSAFKGSNKSIAGSDIKVQISPGKSRPQVTVTDSGNDLELPRIRNYQIKSVKKGVPIIDAKDDTVQRIMMKKRDLKIIPYWICQRKKEGLKRNATAWIFSTFVTVVCVVFPLTSFSSDVAFYVTCSDHYNHTAEVLEKVRSEYEPSTGLKSNPVQTNQKTETNQSENIGIHSPANSAASSEILPAPLLAKSKRSLPNGNSILKNSVWKLNGGAYQIQQDQLHDVTETFLQPQQGVDEQKNSAQFRGSLPEKFSRGTNSYKSKVPNKGSSENLYVKESPSVEGLLQFHETNFEVEIQEYNETSCDRRSVVLNYMLTDEAARELEAHRHVTVDIFEPVFILGSFPSLILCILTRLVVLVTGHKNFLSAYVINMACMPLQLITGALSVHSASYHLGRKGFECWHCTLDNDCADMEPLWWLQDDVTQTLLVSILTKILDGMAGGLVLFVVIIRLLWPEGGHATFWWNTMRGFVIFIAFVFCITVSPLLVITPAMSVMRLEFMELATPFPGREGISLALTILMSLGLAFWCLSFAVIFIYVMYSMYMYCRERTVDN